MVGRLLKVGGVVRRAPAPSTPTTFASTVRPSIDGVFENGRTVTATTGTWNQTPDSVAYQWLRSGLPIVGASSPTYSLVADDVGPGRITVRVTPVKSGWTGGAHLSDAITVNTPADPLPTPDEGLWFAKSVEPSDRKVYCHWFRYPLAFSNAAPPNTYETSYLQLGPDAAIGNILRDRPIIRDLLYTDGAGDHAMPFGGSPAWGVQAQRADIEEAIAIGIDGWFHDVLGGSGQNWDILLNNLAAGSYYPDFDIIPMLDCNGSLGKDSTVETIAQRLSVLLAYGSVPTVNGKRVIASYNTSAIAGANHNHATAAANWTAVYNLLKNTYGHDVTFWHCFSTSPPTSSSVLAGYTHCTAVGRWGYGGADPQIIARASTAIYDLAKGLGRKVFPAVFSHWARARYGEFDESRNLRAHQAAWDKAAQVCRADDMVQICTWNDYSEGHQIAPTAARGYSTWAMTAWNIQKFKHGVAPRVAQDAVVVTHRNSLPGTTVTGGQTTFMVQRNHSDRIAFREHVEVVTFLTAADTIRLDIGGTTYNYSAPAGEYVYSAPAAYGVVRVRTGRGIDHTSPVQIRSTSGNQNRNYVGSYSGRTSSQQGDVTPAS